MKADEAVLLNTIAKGDYTIEKICLRLEKEPSQIINLLHTLISKKLIEVNNSAFLISKIGLLNLSRFFFSQKCKRVKYSYSFADGLPYVPYSNKWKKDTIFNPALYFDPSSTRDDWDKQIVYEIKFDYCKIDIVLLEVIANLLYDFEYWHANGFWKLNCREKAVFGYGIDALKKAVKLVEATGLLFVVGTQDFILIVKSRGKQTKNNLGIRIYLTNDSFPYIDTIDSIYSTLKIFWRFLGIRKLPKGREIELKSRNSVIFLEKPVFFVPEIYGIIQQKAKILEIKEEFPHIIIFNSSNLKTKFSKVNPWLATCSGGFLHDDFALKRKFGVSRFHIIRLPQVNIVTMHVFADHSSESLQDISGESQIF